MTAPPTSEHPDDALLAGLRQDFSGHRFFRAVRFDGLLGDWVATLHDPAHGVSATVIRNSADELREALLEEAAEAEQEARLSAFRSGRTRAGS
ncbi:hypothetical protein [Actinomadura hibisca]|uniref:hypothetical protein n=1 Tax=Actinomadura hibisca TaxID=68565 RepID=UPI00083273AE|nr:hypothetical protein [Actinomadura hibisca]